jgi:hypothetical protein
MELVKTLRVASFPSFETCTRVYVVDINILKMWMIKAKAASNDANNRPFSLTCVLCKIMQRLVSSKLEVHLQNSNTLDNISSLYLLKEGQLLYNYSSCWCGLWSWCYLFRLSRGFQFHATLTMYSQTYKLRYYWKIVKLDYIIFTGTKAELKVMSMHQRGQVCWVQYFRAVLWVPS